MTSEEAYSMISTMGVGVLLVVGILLLVLGIFMIVVDWKILEKTRTEGWKAIIPIYSNYVFYTVFGVPAYFIILNIAAFFINNQFLTLGTYAIGMYTNYKLVKAFRGDNGLAIITMLFPVIGRAVIAFDNTGKYVYDINAANATDFGTNKNQGNNPSTVVPPVATPSVDPNSNQFIQSGNTSCKFCKNCGTKLYVVKGFCPSCGTKIDED